MQRTDKIRLGYTDPMTGQPTQEKQYREVEYADIDGVVLVVHHYYRSSAPKWTARPYMDHLSPDAYASWVQHLSTHPDSGLVFAHIRRRDLLAQIAKDIGSPDWTLGRNAWMALPRDPRWAGLRFRLVRRAPQQWWALPADPSRDTERGPWPSERTALADLVEQPPLTPGP
ncbi:hypothetical protein OG413_20660 [Streptomyces sp. NBC_01433]|uniref:hypothetical protein n=1 Tax=Streptomyces sp. NBC_01433 TaxID=2903864 RepID=UPI002253C4CE|nr:hypothetical protein [Streptomyces sp. NBC_01433]MCX4677687.1 hypothetical protein [Streptomyces sp. NBC_01433]